MNQKKTHSKPALSWNALEYDFREKSSDWFWTLGISAVTIAIIAIIFQNFLFAVLILIGVFSLALYSARRPEKINFVLTNRGVLISEKLYSYQTLDSFWVNDVESNTSPKLIIQSKKLFMPHIIIPLGTADAEEIRDYLLEYLDEEEHEESLIERFTEWLGF